MYVCMYVCKKTRPVVIIYIYIYTHTLHYITLHYITLHYIPLHSITFLHCYIPTFLHSYIPFHSFPFLSIPFHSFPFLSIPFHSFPFLSIPFHSIPFHYITLHYTTLHYTTLHYTTLHYTTLHYTTLHYITLHYTTLHYITLHYITLHYITLHYITLHTYNLHTYIHTYTNAVKAQAIGLCAARVYVTSEPITLRMSMLTSSFCQPGRVGGARMQVQNAQHALDSPDYRKERCSSVPQENGEKAAERRKITGVWRREGGHERVCVCVCVCACARACAARRVRRAVCAYYVYAGVYAKVVSCFALGMSKDCGFMMAFQPLARFLTRFEVLNACVCKVVMIFRSKTLCNLLVQPCDRGRKA